MRAAGLLPLLLLVACAGPASPGDSTSETPATTNQLASSGHDVHALLTWLAGEPASDDPGYFEGAAPTIYSTAEAKQRDPRRLYNATTARRRVASDDFWVTHRTPGGAARGIGPAHTDWDFRKAASDLPVISHETGQRPAWPSTSNGADQLRPPSVERVIMRIPEFSSARGSFLASPPQ